MDDFSARPFVRLGLSWLVEWSDNPEAQLQWAGGTFRFPLNTEQFEAFRAAGEEELSTRRLLTACICRGVRVGQFGHNRHRARTCRVLVDHVRRGRANARRCVLRRASDAFRLNRVERPVFDLKPSAIRRCAGAGSTPEGRLRAARKVGTSMGART